MSTYAGRVLQFRVSLQDEGGNHLRYTSHEHALTLLSAGQHEAAGHKRKIFAIRAITQQPKAIIDARPRHRAAIARSFNRIPMPSPTTHTNDTWDNPQRVVCHKQMSQREHVIWLTPIREGLDDASWREIRQRVRELHGGV
jgi:hypothetical protein